ncbi:MAG: thiolase [Sphingopyxis sp.]|nr:thiolase [Sphingopyxis sp.]
MTVRGKVAIVGVGLAGLAGEERHSAMGLSALAATRALADAQLSLVDVDGLFASSSSQNFPAMSAAEYLGIQPRFVEGAMVGGSSPQQHVLTAALALEAGLCDVALVLYGSNQRSAGRSLQSRAEPQFLEDINAPRNPIGSYALAAARHMHQYGTTRAQLDEVIVAAREWAILNPRARANRPITAGELAAATPIADPFTSFDCCLVTDGAGALVLTRAERAADHAHIPAYLLGAAGTVTHRQISQMPDLTRTGAAFTGPAAFAMAGLDTGDVDLVSLYDAFSINTILFLEDLGFCPKGEGGAFVSNGAIAPGGRLPVNTNGGGLSFLHPGMYGIFLIIEAVEQLRGTCGERQVKGAQVALAHGNGGVLGAQATTIFGTGATL